MMMTAAMCEVCGREPATAFSWLRGQWRLAGQCAIAHEDYYPFADCAHGIAQWLQHLGEKRWFRAADFIAAVARAHGAVPA